MTISGPQGDTQRTNSDGCALFRSITIGNYKITLNTPGYVDKLGDQSPETTATVNPGRVTPASFIYDKAVNMSVDIKTIKPGATFSTTAPSQPVEGGRRSPTTPPTRARCAPTRRTPSSATSNIKPQTLFPFGASYSFFTGSCAYQSPTKASATLNKDYFDTDEPGRGRAR